MKYLIKIYIYMYYKHNIVINQYITKYYKIFSIYFIKSFFKNNDISRL